jgi:hypothetical protein
MLVTKHTNCWEFKNCQVKDECPAYPMFGKLCFSVKGTLCEGQVQGDYQEKIARCRAECDFYKQKIENS